MVFAGEVVDGEAVGERLLVVGPGLVRGVRLVGVLAGLRPPVTYSVFKVSREQVAEFRGVEEVRRDEVPRPAAQPEVTHLDGFLDAVTLDGRTDGA